LFSTFVILVLIPTLYMILEDFKGLVRREPQQIKTEPKSVWLQTWSRQELFPPQSLVGNMPAEIYWGREVARKAAW